MDLWRDGNAESSSSISVPTSHRDGIITFDATIITTTNKHLPVYYRYKDVLC
jgi:hypothetical protein